VQSRRVDFASIHTGPGGGNEIDARGFRRTCQVPRITVGDKSQMKGKQR